MTELNDADLPPLPRAKPEYRSFENGGSCKEDLFVEGQLHDYARQAIKDYLAKQQVVRLEAGIKGGDTWHPLKPGELEQYEKAELYEVRRLIVKEELR